MNSVLQSDKEEEEDWWVLWYFKYFNKILEDILLKN